MSSQRRQPSKKFIRAEPASRLGLIRALDRMQRSAVNLFSAAGASIGVLFGVYVADSFIGTDNPEYFFSLAGLLAMPFAVGAHLLVSRRFRRARRRQQLFLAVSGLVAFLASVAVLLVGIDAVFPKAVAA